jgi:hypothetical protein
MHMTSWYYYIRVPIDITPVLNALTADRVSLPLHTFSIKQA